LTFEDRTDIHGCHERLVTPSTLLSGYQEERLLIILLLYLETNKIDFSEDRHYILAIKDFPGNCSRKGIEPWLLHPVKKTGFCTG